MTLFKYFSAGKIKDFVLGYVSLTPPKYLNDPFEFAVSREPAGIDELSALFDRFVEDDYAIHVSNVKPPMSLAEFKKSREEKRTEWIERVTTQAYALSEPAFMQEGLSKIYGVVCMSEVPDDLLMWGHYTDSYRGFVAEFDCIMPRTPPDFNSVWTPFGLAFRVTYDDKPPVLKADHSNALLCCSTKPEQWSYEREWRAIRLLSTADHIDDDDFCFVGYPPQTLQRVICGNRMSEIDREDLRNLHNYAESQHVCFQTAFPDAFERKVRFRE